MNHPGEPETNLSSAGFRLAWKVTSPVISVSSPLSPPEIIVIAFPKKGRWLAAASVLIAGCVVSIAIAAPPTTPRSRSAEAIEIARLRLKLYERVDYPLRMRQLRTDIEIMEARVASLRRRVKETDRFRYAEGMFTATERLRLELLEAELVLRDWKHELTLLQIHHQDERRLRRLEIEAAERLAASRPTASPE